MRQTVLAPVRTDPPATRPVTLEELKQNVVALHDEDDALLEAMLDAAVGLLDGHAGLLGRCLISQGWRQDLADWPQAGPGWGPKSGIVRLPYPDVSKATISYFDRGNARRAVAPGDFELLADARGSYVAFRNRFARPALCPERGDAVQIAFTAGYGEPSDVPGPIRQAILMLATRWYLKRGDTDHAAVPDSIWSLLAPHARLSV